MPKPEREMYEEVEALFDLKVSSSGADITIKMSGQQITVPYEDFMLLRQGIEDLIVNYQSQRLAAEFEKLSMPHQMHIVGGILHSFTAGLPSGAAFAEVSMEKSNWRAFLVKNNSGYEKEVNALSKAGDGKI